MVERKQRHGTAKAQAKAKPLPVRLVTPFFVLLALGLIVSEKVSPGPMADLRLGITDAMAPILSVAATPVASARGAVETVAAYFALAEENRTLRAENERLRAWYLAAQQLSAENRSLRNLSQFSDERLSTVASARVIADTGGAYADSRLIAAGQASGVEKGFAVISGSGLVGRVQDAGQRSARILLVSDINSRVPAVIGSARHPVIVAGANNGRLQIVALADDAAVAVGDIVLTSGQGGVFPAGLPVGIVSSVSDEGVVEVRPAADLGSLSAVRIVETPAAIVPPVAVRDRQTESDAALRPTSSPASADDGTSLP